MIAFPFSLRGSTVLRVALPLAIGAAVLALPGATAAEEKCTQIHEVDIQHVFTPKLMVIKQGECIRFTNNHTIEHSAIGLQREFNTGTLMPGSTAVVRFPEAAAIPFWCGLHPPMMGNIVVEAN